MPLSNRTPRVVIVGSDGEVTNPGGTGRLLFENTTNLAALTDSPFSAWLDANTFRELVAVKTSTGGTYALTVEWSSNGTATHFSEDIAVGEGIANTATRSPLAPFVRFRVRNTNAVTPFTAHRTIVYARR